MTGSRRPTSSQPLPSWSSDRQRSACVRAPATSSVPKTWPAMAAVRPPGAARPPRWTPSPRPGRRPAAPRVRLVGDARPCRARTRPRSPAPFAGRSSPMGRIRNSCITPPGLRPASCRCAAAADRVTTGTRCRIGTMTIYLDHAATTPLRREVLERMMPYLTEAAGQSPRRPTAPVGAPARPSTRPMSRSPRRSTPTRARSSSRAVARSPSTSPSRVPRGPARPSATAS